MQAPIGILMLETRFPRVYGDAGNPATWPFPVVIRVVHGATPARVMRDRAHGLVDAFIAAAQALAADGAAGVTTTCGFLCLQQDQIARALPVPFASSSLLQVPMVARLLPAGRRVGILTVDSRSLGPEHLQAAGIDPATPIMGTEAGTEFSRVLLGDLPVLDLAAAQADLLDAGRRLLARHPEVGAIVLECANMPPYAATLAAQLGVPVYDWYSMVTWFAAGLRPRAFLARPATIVPDPRTPR
ncbi:MAG: aspartate/glutamate racemase family protein [Acidobacteriota bacterium]